MSKTNIRHGAVIRCDIVHVRETATEVLFENECKSQFVTYSVSAVARKQAVASKWLRVKIRYVDWTGDPPGEPKKKVDICPAHAGDGDLPGRVQAPQEGGARSSEGRREGSARRGAEGRDRKGRRRGSGGPSSR